MDRLNIVYVNSHDTGRYVQPYGYDVPTPNIQRLAEDGVVFRRCFSAAPTCSPSRAALLTGQCAHSSGMLGLTHRGFSLADPNQHLAHTLRKAGYHTALIGVQHVAQDPAVLGYDSIWTEGIWARQVAAAAEDFLSNSPKQPFYLEIGFEETHRKYPDVPSEHAGRYLRPPVTVPDTPETRMDFAAFRIAAARLDEGIGRVVDTLESRGLLSNTLIICTTDHGIAFPGMKCTLTDHGIGVMLILRGPRRSAAGEFPLLGGGQVCEAMVSHVDLYPTICELVGIDPPGFVQGVSMLPLLRGQTDRIRDEVFAEVSYHAAYEPQRAVRTDRYKYIRRYVEHDHPILANIDDGPAKDIWLAHGLGERKVAAEQLYDLIFDPNEACNIATDPAARDVLTQMRARLDRWMKATNDPLLAGPLPAPPGALISDPDDVSANDVRRRRGML